MIINIENKEIKAKLSKEKTNLPAEIKRNIDEFWNKTTKENSNLWNGEQLCVTECIRNEKEVVFTCQKSDYAHYLYDERIGLPKEYFCSSLVAACLLETSDGYYIVGELADNTSYPHCMQLSGGSCDNDDIIDNEINIFDTIQREVQEEININLQDTNQIGEYKIKYMTLPNKEAHTYILFAKGILKKNKEEMESHYKKYLEYLQETNGEIEFSKIHFIKKGNSTEELNKLNNPKRDYLLELLEMDSKE